jgi:hypothetical protein
MEYPDQVTEEVALLRSRDIDPMASTRYLASGDLHVTHGDDASSEIGAFCSKAALAANPDRKSAHIADGIDWDVVSGKSKPRGG